MRRDAVEHRAPRALLRGLRRVPVNEHLLRCRGDRVGEDVRMPPHHLLDEPCGHVVDRERVVRVLRGDRRVEQDLPEQVAQFFAQVGARTGLDGVDELRRLLHEIGHEVVVRDALRPDAAFPDRAHRVGSFAERVRRARRIGCLAGCGHADASFSIGPSKAGSPARARRR